MSTDDEIERQLNHSFWGGRAAAMEDYAHKLRQLAGDHFSRGNDAMANFYRSMADDAAREGKEYRNDQKRFADPLTVKQVSND